MALSADMHSTEHTSPKNVRNGFFLPFKATFPLQVDEDTNPQNRSLHKILSVLRPKVKTVVVVLFCLRCFWSGFGIAFRVTSAAASAAAAAAAEPQPHFL